MSSFDALISSMDGNIFDVMATQCTYVDGQATEHPTRVIIDKNVEMASAYDTQMPVRRNIASLIKAEVPDPKRGHTITITETGETYTVDQLNTDDGHVITVLLR